MKRWFVLLLLLTTIAIWAPSESMAQGPLPEYYYAPETELGFADCWIKFTEGSRSRIPFLTVVDRSLRAPLGIGDYEHDLQRQAPVVFIGDGIAFDKEKDFYYGRRLDYSVGTIDIAGKVVLLCLDCWTSGDKIPPIGQRLAWAATHGAAAAAVFSVKREAPILAIETARYPEASGIPAVTISKRSALRLLASAGEDGVKLLDEWESIGSPPFSRELISRLELNLQGRFDTFTSPNFIYRFPPGALSSQQVEKMTTYSEQALAFISKLLPGSEEREWRPAMTTFFPDYDSKVFYTLHWGTGLSTDTGTFMVWGSAVPSYELIVHETAHLYNSTFWSLESSSFLHEGIAMYAQAQAVDPAQNHRRILSWMENGQLLPLAELVDHEIGMPGTKTDIGYPASGSFVGFLCESYNKEKVREAYILDGRSAEERSREDTWSIVFGKTLAELEHEWLQWIRTHTEHDSGPHDAER